MRTAVAILVGLMALVAISHALSPNTQDKVIKDGPKNARYLTSNPKPHQKAAFSTKNGSKADKDNTSGADNTNKAPQGNKNGKGNVINITVNSPGGAGGGGGGAADAGGGGGGGGGGAGGLTIINLESLWNSLWGKKHKSEFSTM